MIGKFLPIGNPLMGNLGCDGILSERLTPAFKIPLLPYYKVLCYSFYLCTVSQNCVVTVSFLYLYSTFSFQSIILPITIFSSVAKQ